MGSFLETWASWCEIQTRIALAQGRSKEAVGLLQELRAKLSAAGMRFLEARASVLLALAFDRSGDNKAAAFEALDAALRYASTEPMINSFVDEGEPMLTLLSKRQSDAVRCVTTAEGQIKHLLVRFVQEAPRTIQHRHGPRCRGR